jgi:peroxiredoxin Q/BCP
VAYFAASADDSDTNRKFAESLDVTYPILSDPDKDVARAYGVVGALIPWPSRWTFYIGGDGTILDIDKDVRPATAGEDMVARLAALGIPRRPSGRP